MWFFLMSQLLVGDHVKAGMNLVYFVILFIMYNIYIFHSKTCSRNKRIKLKADSLIFIHTLIKLVINSCMFSNVV
jgi:hypothetical protein